MTKLANNEPVTMEVIAKLCNALDCKIDDIVEITLDYGVHEFILKYKTELEKLNYYSWARFLEQVNDDKALIRVIDKLEIATPRRDNLAIYRELLRREFEQDTCFYCGKHLNRGIHVDHFIPWTFVKDDKLWNFVLACPTCNVKKSNKLPTKDHIVQIVGRNQRMLALQSQLVIEEFENYSDGIIERMWNYAKKSGFKEYICRND